MEVRSIYCVSSKPAHNDTVTQWGLFKEGEFSSTITGVNANIIDPSTAVELHQHENIEHMYFILSGVGTVRIGDEEQEVREGDAVYLPPGLTHTMRNTGTYPLRFLAIGAKIK